MGTRSFQGRQRIRKTALARLPRMTRAASFRRRSRLANALRTPMIPEQEEFSSGSRKKKSRRARSRGGGISWSAKGRAPEGCEKGELPHAHEDRPTDRN